MKSGIIIDLQEEKIKRKIPPLDQYACGSCLSEGRICPASLPQTWPHNGGFEGLDIGQRLEWLRHTRHLA